MTILTKILREKEKEVAQLKAQQAPFPQAPEKDVPSIRQTFRQAERMNIISEIKRASPSKGAIDTGVDPVKQATEYAASGAGAISVLTDTPFFQGSMADLRAVREAVDIPILCKDFIIDQIQIDQAKASGASIILLIVAALDQPTLQHLYTYAKQLHLDVLVEVHNADEMTEAQKLGADIIGINNRDLQTFNVDLAVTEQLTKMVDNPDTLLIGESGIKTRQDAERLQVAGVHGVLVGETLMRANNLSEAFQDIRVPLQKGFSQHVR